MTCDCTPPGVFGERAACRGMDTNIFFPERGTAQVKTIRAICEKCPVWEKCRQWGIHHEEDGWWGGMSPNQRVNARRASGIELVEIGA